MKKTIIILSAILLIFTGYVNAQTKFKNVADAAEALRVAMIDANDKMLSALADDSLSYGHSHGQVEGKRQFIENLTSGKSDFVTIDITGQQITIFKNTALIRHTLSATTNDSGKPGNVKLNVLQVWQKKDHTWKLIARQAVKPS